MLLVLACLPALAWAQCSSGPSPSSGIQPSIASGYAWAVAATGLTSPRGLQFDSAGNLLVVEEGKGLSSFKVDDQSQADSACGITLTDQKTLVDDSELNHGLALSTDQGALFVSSSSEARAYTYDPETNAVGSNPATIVKNMDNSDHTSRTLLYPRNATGAQLVVSRGSSENLDAGAADVRNGRSQVKAFNVTGVPRDGYDFARDGTLLGHGLRNSVGVAEHPVTGGIWTVENSADNIRRGGEDVHANNPGEELNFLGYLNGTRYARQGTDFGYPDCFAAWQPDELPENQGFEVGSTFALDPSGDSSRCGNVTAPSLTWQAHMAPIDIKFNNSATEAWVSFHGSWNRRPPVGYQLAYVRFANGVPADDPTSDSSAVTVLSNADLAACPGDCFRPAGLAFDARGRLFMASDASGEIYVVVRTGAATPASGGAGPSGTASASATSTPTSEAADGRCRAWFVVTLAFLSACLLR